MSNPALARIETEALDLYELPALKASQHRLDSLNRHREALAQLAAVVEPAKEVSHEYTLWAEGAEDGEFQLWNLDRLITAIIALRAALAAAGYGDEADDA